MTTLRKSLRAGPARFISLAHRGWLCLIAAPVFALASAAASHGAAAGEVTALFLIGDSTIASYPATRAVHGWGQELPEFFSPAVAIKNHGASGRSSKSFLAEGRWDRVLEELHAGNFVIIQFGHNDSKEDVARHTDPRGSYRDNLLRFIRDTRAKRATPILATSVARRNWTAGGEFVDTLGDYPAVTRELAAQENVPLLDLHARTTQLERQLGVEGSKKLHLHLAPNEHPSLPNGLADNTHYCAYGASRVAELAAAEIARLDLPLARAVAIPRGGGRE